MPVRVEYATGSGYQYGGQKLSTAHRGLLLDKFMGVKTERGGESKKKDGRLPLWRGLCEAGLTPGAYKLAFERWRTYTKTLPAAVCFTGAVRGRMALGLGIESVQEIGCRLHSTYGTPVIPGSSLKGVLRQGLASMADYETYVDRLFGSATQTGSVEVYDAWWVPDSRSSGLVPDVITVHHQEYYSGKSAPTGRESPVPNHFLTVTGSFYFCLMVEEGWQTFVKKAAQHFLESQGVGAKRSAGYGRFERFADVK